MDKCYYNGKLVSAIDFAQSFEAETELRQSYSLLTCCDPECKSELIFRNGKKRVPHFAHKKGSTQCCYNEYSSQMDNVIRDIRDAVFSQLNKATNNAKYEVDFDVRISKEYRHITPVTVVGEKKFAVEIMRCNKPLSELNKMSSSYRNIGYTPLPIIIEGITHHFNDMNDTYYTLRYWIHNSKEHTVLLYNPINQSFYMCKRDSESYVYENKHVESIEAINIFVKLIDICELEISSEGFVVNGFEESYVEWKDIKKAKLDIYAANQKELQNKINNLRSQHANNEQKSQRTIEDIILSKADYNEKIFPLLQSLVKELDFKVSEEEFLSYYEVEKNRKILYQLYPDREKLKSRLRSQILKRREND